MVPRKKRQKYRIEAMRIAARLQQQPPSDWDGIWALLDEHREKGQEQLYAIVNWDEQMVKFGKSLKPGMRLKTIQTSHGTRLKLFAFCRHEPPFTEREVHAKLKHIRLRGEWFELNDESRELITKMREHAGIRRSW